MPMPSSKKFSFSVPRCDRQYWAEFSNSYSQHLRYLAKAKRRTSASLNASSRQNGTCSHLRGGANMCRVGIKDARRSSQIESSKTPFASISFRILEQSRQQAQTTSKSCGIDRVTLHFHQSIGVAATDLNICVTLLKRICRLHGLQRWPGRKVISLQKRTTSITRDQRGASTQTKSMSTKKLIIIKLEMANILLMP
mmetsp:Transcript_13375/g.36583  ORF Transcript_13375/g.36583 Transcript_13375/m.36583 type:complete len:196 (+) Transcript_13375:237-824(+)